MDHDLRSRWSRLRNGLVRGGVEYALTAGVSYLPDWLMRYTHHALLRCEGQALGLTDRARSAVRIATPDDRKRLVRPGDLSLEVLDQRFRDGDTCVMVLRKGRVLASAWAATGTRTLVGLGQNLHIPPSAFYIHDAYTDPSARRMGLATLCYQRLFDLLAKRGRRSAYAAVEVLNRPSLTAHATWGFVPVGRARKLGVPQLRATYCPRWPHPNRRFRLFIRSTRSAYPIA